MTLTQIVMLAALVILLTYDGIALLLGGITNTISWQFIQLSTKYPIISFGLGFLAGHLVWQIPNSLCGK